MLINLPTKFGFSKIEKWGLERAGVGLMSRFTGASQRIVYPYAVWVFKGTLIDYPEGAEARDIRRFLIQLKGQQNTFKMPVPGYQNPSSGYVGTGKANATAVRATQLTVTGLAANAAYLKAGEYFTVNDELKLVMADAATNGAGQATVTFEPPLRKAIAASGVVDVVVNNPYVVLHSDEDDVAVWSLAPPIRHGIKISFVEEIVA